MIILLVAVGGALGAAGRYLLAGWVQGLADTTFPRGTLAVNLLGSFLLGLLVPALPGSPDAAPLSAVLLKAGLLGSFTTFSTFAFEAVRLVEEGRPGMAAAYLGISLAGGLASLAAGLALGGGLG